MAELSYLHKCRNREKGFLSNFLMPSLQELKEIERVSVVNNKTKRLFSKLESIKMLKKKHLEKSKSAFPPALGMAMGQGTHQTKKNLAILHISQVPGLDIKAVQHRAWPKSQELNPPRSSNNVKVNDH